MSPRRLLIILACVAALFALAAAQSDYNVASMRGGGNRRRQGPIRRKPNPGPVITINVPNGGHDNYPPEDDNVGDY